MAVATHTHTHTPLHTPKHMHMNMHMTVAHVVGFTGLVPRVDADACVAEVRAYSGMGPASPASPVSPVVATLIRHECQQVLAAAQHTTWDAREGVHQDHVAAAYAAACGEARPQLQHAAEATDADRRLVIHGVTHAWLPSLRVVLCVQSSGGRPTAKDVVHLVAHMWLHGGADGSLLEVTTSGAHVTSVPWAAARALWVVVVSRASRVAHEIRGRPIVSGLTSPPASLPVVLLPGAARRVAGDTRSTKSDEDIVAHARRAVRVLRDTDLCAALCDLVYAPRDAAARRDAQRRLVAHRRSAACSAADKEACVALEKCLL